MPLTQNFRRDKIRMGVARVYYGDPTVENGMVHLGETTGDVVFDPGPDIVHPRLRGMATPHRSFHRGFNATAKVPLGERGVKVLREVLFGTWDGNTFSVGQSRRAGKPGARCLLIVPESEAHLGAESEYALWLWNAFPKPGSMPFESVSESPSGMEVTFQGHRVPANPARHEVWTIGDPADVGVSLHWSAYGEGREPIWVKVPMIAAYEHRSGVLTSDGGLVSAWQDLVGGGAPDFTSSGTARPMSAPEGLVFDGVNDAMGSPNHAWWQALSSYYVVFVAAFTDTADVRYSLAIRGRDGMPSAAQCFSIDNTFFIDVGDTDTTYDFSRAGFGWPADGSTRMITFGRDVSNYRFKARRGTDAGWIYDRYISPGDAPLPSGARLVDGGTSPGVTIKAYYVLDHEPTEAEIALINQYAADNFGAVVA